MGCRHGHVTPAAADRASRDAAAVLCLGLPADTLLYLLLPLHHAAFGVSLAEAGVLLAANRLVRIGVYALVADVYARRGPRLACAAAAVGSALAALGYAVLSGVWALLVARLLWGVCFAALNIATQALPTAAAEGAAARSGRARAVIALGPMLGLLGGAVLSQVAGPRAPFVVLGLAALAGLHFARSLPGADGASPVLARGRPRFAWPERLDTYAFVQGLALDGVFVIGLSVLAAAALPGQAALAAGAALALRYAAEVVLGPPGGRLAERYGARSLLVGLSCATAAGLLLVGVGWLWTGAVVTVLLRGLLQPLPPPVVAAANPGPLRVPALARFATWRDLGAGAGPLLAGALLPVLPPAVLYGAAALLLAASGLALAPALARGGAIR